MTLNEVLLPYQSLKSFPIVCAVSGGVDSMGLLHALKMAHFNVIVVHINHQLRAEANQDEAFVQSVADAYEFPCETVRVQLNPHENIQNEGHQQRLSFYQKIALKYHAQHVFLAHHQDDQIEHFLIQIARGFTELAWVGMAPTSSTGGLQLVRPLLELSKTTLIEYAQLHNVAYRHDASNDADYYLRNRIRHQVIPKLKAQAPELLQRIIPAQNALKTHIENEKTHVLSFNKNGATLSIQAFQDATFIQQKRWLHYLWEASNDLPPRSDRFWAMIAKRLNDDTSNVHFHVVDDWYLSLDYGVMTVVQMRAPMDTPFIIEDFGSHSIHEGLSLEVSPQKKAHVSGLSLELCYNERTFPIKVRTAQKGDILAFDYGHKKINQWFKDVKIPWGLRPQILVIETSDERLVILHPSFPKLEEKCASKVYLYEVKNAEQ